MECDDFRSAPNLLRALNQVGTDAVLYGMHTINP